MSSWPVCNCGQRVHKTLFAGGDLRVMVDEGFLDRDFTGRPAEDFVSELILACDLAVTCMAYGRLYIVDEKLAHPTRAFAPVA